MVSLPHLLDAPAPLFLQLLAVVLCGLRLVLQLLQASCPLLFLSFLHESKPLLSRQLGQLRVLGRVTAAPRLTVTRLTPVWG